MSAATTVHDGKVVTRTDRGAPAGPLLLALFAVLYLGALFFRHLWPVDETRYAEVAREMGERGSFLLPVLKGAVYTDKPPLLFWLMLALHAVANAGENTTISSRYRQLFGGANLTGNLPVNDEWS